jgi:Superinfection immunity protein
MTFLLVAALLYFLPAIIGHNKRDAAGIFILNLVAGWTGIGWIVALLWACASDPRVHTVLVPAGGSFRYSSRCGAMEHVGAQYCWACGRHL